MQIGGATPTWRYGRVKETESTIGSMDQQNTRDTYGIC